MVHLGGTEAQLRGESAPAKTKPKVIGCRTVKRDWEAEPLPRDPEVHVDHATVLRLARESRDAKLARIRRLLIR